jgi:NADH-quinone oxidoreductase subunit E
MTQASTLPHEVIEAIERRLPHYPENQKQSVVLYALHAAQHVQGGYLTRELMDGVAAYLGMAPIAVYEVASFYSMLVTEPVGRHSISVCTNISCMLRGGYELFARFQDELGIGHKGVTADGVFSLEEVECIGACSWAPAIQVNYDFHDELKPEHVPGILDSYRAKAEERR